MRWSLREPRCTTCTRLVAACICTRGGRGDERRALFHVQPAPARPNRRRRRGETTKRGRRWGSQ